MLLHYEAMAKEIARKAGELVRDAFNQPKIIFHKNGKHYDLVTETDKATESLIRDFLKEAYPEHM